MRSIYIYVAFFVQFSTGFKPNTDQIPVPDSSLVKNKSLKAGFSASIHRASNWQGFNTGSWSLSSDIEYSIIRKTGKYESMLLLNSDLAYTGFIDSIKQKTADRLKADYFFKNANKRFTRTISAGFTTGILNDYEYVFDPLTGNSYKYQTGNILSPATMETGFGIGYSLAENSIINISLSTARVRSIPDFMSNESTDGILLTKFMDGKLLFDYGFTLQFIIDKELNRFTIFKSTGKLFIKNIHRDAIEYNSELHLIFRISRLIQIKSQMSFNYDPLFSHKLQMRYEITTGIYYSKTP